MIATRFHPSGADSGPQEIAKTRSDSAPRPWRTHSRRPPVAWCGSSINRLAVLASSAAQLSRHPSAPRMPRWCERCRHWALRSRLICAAHCCPQWMRAERRRMIFVSHPGGSRGQCGARHRHGAGGAPGSLGGAGGGYDTHKNRGRRGVPSSGATDQCVRHRSKRRSRQGTPPCCCPALVAPRAP